MEVVDAGCVSFALMMKLTPNLSRPVPKPLRPLVMVRSLLNGILKSQDTLRFKFLAMVKVTLCTFMSAIALSSDATKKLSKLPQLISSILQLDSACWTTRWSFVSMLDMKMPELLSFWSTRQENIFSLKSILVFKSNTLSRNRSLASTWSSLKSKSLREIHCRILDFRKTQSKLRELLFNAVLPLKTQKRTSHQILAESKSLEPLKVWVFDWTLLLLSLVQSSHRTTIHYFVKLFLLAGTWPTHQAKWDVLSRSLEFVVSRQTFPSSRTSPRIQNLSPVHVIRSLLTKIRTCSTSPELKIEDPVFCIT